MATVCKSQGKAVAAMRCQLTAGAPQLLQFFILYARHAVRRAEVSSNKKTGNSVEEEGGQAVEV